MVLLNSTSHGIVVVTSACSALGVSPAGSVPSRGVGSRSQVRKASAIARVRSVVARLLVHGLRKVGVAIDVAVIPAVIVDLIVVFLHDGLSALELLFHSLQVALLLVVASHELAHHVSLPLPVGLLLVAQRVNGLPVALSFRFLVCHHLLEHVELHSGRVRLLDVAVRLGHLGLLFRVE